MIHYYIDPGTGSMLFTILVGIISAGIYGMKNFIIKMKFIFSGDNKASKEGADNMIPIIIVTDDKRYWNIFKPICDEFERRGERIVYYTASEDDPALKEDYLFVETQYTGAGNKSYAKWNRINANIVLSSTPSLDVFQWKRSKDANFYIHIPHAVSDITLYRMFGIDYYDAMILSAEFQAEQIRQLERIRKLPAKEIELLGVTYFDSMKARLDRLVKDTNERLCVLLAPSWGPSSIFNKYGSKILDQLLQTDYEIIVRPHPQSFTSEKEMIEGLMKRYPDSERIKWNRDTDNFDVLNKADILISDFSGVLFDFSMVFDKPVIYTDTDFDTAPYDASWIDEQLWTFKVLPKIGCELNESNIDYIDYLIRECFDEPVYGIQRERVRKECWCNIGKSAELITDYLLDKNRELIEEREARQVK